jgi:anti-sigma factor RsiW
MSHLGHRLSALIDGELGHVDRDRVLVHLVRCEPCRVEAAALRMLKRRMNALGGAAADSALNHRLMRLALPGDVPADPAATGEPGWFWPAAGSGPSPAGARELRPSRFVVAGCCAFLLVSLGAAAFAAGGGSPQPGPRITPAVDVLMVQHEIMTGVVPVTRPRPAPAPSAGKIAVPQAP